MFRCYTWSGGRGQCRLLSHGGLASVSNSWALNREVGRVEDRLAKIMKDGRIRKNTLE